MAELDDLTVTIGEFKPDVPKTVEAICQCPHCGNSFPFKQWICDGNAIFCESCDDFHAGFVCPNPDCAEVMGAAGHYNGQITVTE